MRFKTAMLFVFLFAFAAVLAVAQEDAPELEFDFTLTANNPILPRGDVDAWDGLEGMVFAPHVIEYEGMYYMFYSGADNDRGRPNAIGLATSEDGVTWEKFEGNPILEPDNEGYDGICVSNGVPFVEEDGTWVLYYAANAQACYGPGQTIARATAPSPEGPWTSDDEPILTSGTDSEWDDGFIMPHTVLKTDDGYIMYYSGGTEYLIPLPRLIGMATSPDGLTWTKCNNPTTIEAPCSESDPVFEVQEDGSTAPFEAWAVSVMQKEDGSFEMFFSSTCPEFISQNCPSFLAYATSPDGINWTTYTDEGNRVQMPGCEGEFACNRLGYPSALVIEDEYYVYFTGCTNVEHDCEIGLVTGTITPTDG